MASVFCVQSATAMPVHDPKRAFPPTMGTFSLKQDRRTYFGDPPGEKLPMSVWLKPGQKPIKLSAAAKVDLARAIGEKNMRVLDAGIGFAPGRETEPPRMDPIFRYETAWQTAPRPVFKQNTSVKKNEQGGAFLSNPCTVRGKFFWPDMTNENINGRWKKHPMELQMPGAVRDLRSWLSMYGEPDPGKIPTGAHATSERQLVRARIHVCVRARLHV